MSTTDEGLDLPIDEEEEAEEEQVEEEEEHWSLYNSASFISGPYQSEKSTIHEEVLKFHFSFGYDCRKYFNLTCPDPDTLIFASGNFINFFDVRSKTISFRRSALGGGIGHIKANPHPDFPHVAVAENGPIPLIIIYDWPSMDIISVLKGGSSRLYSHLDFSTDGELLVSQGGEPDYLITVWNWAKRKILLRTKSSVNDVFRVKFSPYVPGQLTTCGVAHIKFWKMASTFTGLKLKGELGRFGKTEFSDILGVLPMPDEKVVSGCSWGNILVWDAGLIKLEVFRTLRRKCHDGPIVQISFSDGELTTVAMDGHVKVWWYEKIDQADPPDDDRVIQIEPTYDFYTPGLMLMCIRKRYPDPKDTTFFAQDGNGGIALIDLNSYATPREAVQLYKCHAGKVVSIASCPWGPYLASLGEDGRVYVYKYPKKEMIFDYQYPAKGTCMIWLSHKISKHCDEILMGFDDGTLRLSVLRITDATVDLTVTHTIKPHEKPITQISINSSNTVLVSGSEDCTIFFFQINSEAHVELVPIGYIRLPNPVTCFTWHLTRTDELLVGCLHGEIIQLEVPKETQPYTSVSYLLELETVRNSFKSYKAQIRRDIRLKEIQARKDKKVAKKRIEMEKLMAENPGLEIDEEVYLADSDSEEELEPLHIPEVPNRIIWMQSIPADGIWLSMAGYDAGYIYEYTIDQKSEVPGFFKMVDDADDMEISSYVYNYNKKYLIFAMQNGEIRVNKISDGDHHDLSDYWSLPMHDNQNGFVPKMCFSFDEKNFFTCGHDGNVFSYTFHPENGDYIPPHFYTLASTRDQMPAGVTDEANYDKLSLEQASLKKEQDRIDRLAAKHREQYRSKLKYLRERFFKMLKRNQKLLPSQKIPLEELEVDKRVTEYVNMKLDEELDLVKRKLEFEVKKSEVRMTKLRGYFVDNLIFNPIIVTGLRADVAVKMLRQNKVPPQNKEMLKVIEMKLLEEEMKSRPIERPPLPPKVVRAKKEREQGLEYFLVNVSLTAFEQNRKHNKLVRLLQKYRARKLKWEKREEVWAEFFRKKPLPGINHPDDAAALAEAKSTIGDYKLKTDQTYKASKEQRETTVRKYKELLLARVKQSSIRYNFNKKVSALRDEKLKIREELEALKSKLQEIHQEIPESQRQEVPVVRESESTEFPEKNFEINVQLKIEEEVDETTVYKSGIVPEPADFDRRQREVLSKKTKMCEEKGFANFANLDFEALCKLSKDEKKDTFWESDVRKRRLERKLFEQNKIISLMDKRIQDFDNRVEHLNRERFQVEVDAKIMDIFMVTLHQELIILKEFEALEDDFQAKVNRKISELLDMADVLTDLKEQVVSHTKRIEKGQEQIRIIQIIFQQTTSDNKFFDFLRKVFKKKYKVPRVRRGDESSSEESSSSSDSTTEEDDEGKSIDSRDFGIIRQDLNVCPKGCDPEMYDFTVGKRSERHQIEIANKEEQKTIEMLKKEMEIHNKKTLHVEKELKACQLELEKYQRQKQDKLNNVRCTVVLRLHQLQHLTPDNKTSNITDTLVFSETRLSDLYKRVSQLQAETEQQINKQKMNVKHYTRMKTDCDYMSRTIKDLQGVITSRMKTKFGKVVDINEIEEAMLKRTFGKDDLHNFEEVLLKKIVRDLRLSVMDIKGTYMDDFTLWQDAIVRTQKELTYALRYNTSQQELLTFLVKEKAELKDILVSQQKKKQHLVGVADVTKNYTEEIGKLQKIVEEQYEQIQELKDEIKLLRTKGMVLKPKEPKQEIVDEEATRVWEHLKDLTEEEEEEEEEEERKPFSTEIVIPTTIDEKATEIAAELVQEMLDSLNLQLSKKSNENFVREILSSIMRGISKTELIDELIRHLSLEPDAEQRGIIETAAEQLYVVGEPDITDEDAHYCSQEIMEDVVDEILLTKGEPETVIARMIEKLVDQLPLDFLRDTNAIEYLITRLLESHLNVALDRQEIIQMLHTQEAKNIFNEILDKVFESGVDLLYYIKDH